MKYSVFQGFLFICSLYSASCQTSCSSYELLCDDGSQCIHKLLWCDQEENCNDKSDEKYCAERSFLYRDPNGCKKSHRHFLCENGQCYPITVKCDHYRDCSDGSDEKNCTVTDFKELAVALATPLPTSKPNTTRSGHELETENGGVLSAETKAVKWLLSERRGDYGWGTSTDRALTALALAKPELFIKPNEDALLMKKRLQIQATADFIRNRTVPMTLNRLALYINALLATCDDPTNFHGLNLVQELRQSTNFAYEHGQNTRRGLPFINPIVHLSLCLVNESTQSDIDKLQEVLNVREDADKWLDMQYISVIALSCIIENHSFGRQYIETLRNVVSSMAKRMNTSDGSFGNIYSTALAAQALLASQPYAGWTADLSIRYLANLQHTNGTFGDILVTYLTLPALGRKSLVNLRNSGCPKSTYEASLKSLVDFKGPSQNVRYSLYYEDSVDLSYSIVLKVPSYTPLLDIMRLAQYMDSKFRFLYDKDEDGSISVYSIGDIVNDAEKGKYWHLYANLHDNPSIYSGKRETDRLLPYVHGIHELVPKPDDHIAFWYH